MTLEELLKISENFKLENFENITTNSKLKTEIIRYLEVKSDLVLKREHKVFEFTAQMLFATFKQNNRKYFNDTLWTMSTSNKRLKTSPVLKHERLGVYSLIVKKVSKD